ncbi:MAG: alkaline phosphatase [Syntrophobacteraceae bacterium]
MSRHTRKSAFQLLSVVFILASSQAAFAGKAKNVILMIGDGMGFNAFRSADCYTGGKAVFEDFDVRLSVQTNSADNPAGYDPKMMWSDFAWSMKGATDSSAAATAIYSGVKVTDASINWSAEGQPIKTFFELASEAGRGSGAVSTVEFSHATPATVAAHNASRKNYSDLANEMIYKSGLDVVMGAGNPDYDKNGRPTEAKDYKFVGGQETWDNLKKGAANGFTLIETKERFEQLASGKLHPDKVIGVPEVHTTLQYDRDDPDGDFDPKLGNVPTLETMTKGALNVLSKNPKGFVLMVEGGAIDWANHGGKIDRLIEEQTDFNAAVKAVVAYLDAGTNGANWDDTLVIVTADHECGDLWGQGTYVDANNNKEYNTGETFNGFKPVADNGPGHIPGVQYALHDHTNALVPLFAKGAGAELFADYVIGSDPEAPVKYSTVNAFDGRYIDNTSIFKVMKKAALE